MGSRAGKHELGPGLRRQRIDARLLHHADQVGVKIGLGDFTCVYTVKLSEAQKRHLAGGGDSQPVALKHA